MVNKLADVVNRTARRGGRIIVPAFAVGRTQQLVLLLHQLANEKRIPNIPIFVDSPLAMNVTAGAPGPPRVLRRRDQRITCRTSEDPFGFQRLQYVREASESKKLNDLHGPFVVISASGMCEQGRILHHLRNNIEDPRNTVLITGFQAAGYAGPEAGGKWQEVQIFGEPMRVRAEISEPGRVERPRRPGRVATLDRALAAGLQRVFLVHGEPRSRRRWPKLIHSNYGVAAAAAQPGGSVRLSLV